MNSCPRVHARTQSNIASMIFDRLSAFTITATMMLLTLAATTPAAKAQSCTGLCLQQITCSNNGTTSISGKVYAPNGIDVLPGVLVYVPNAAVQPFPPGAQCLQAGQPASGSPLISTTTAADGSFTLKNAPVGTNIPLVIQAGKWRRQFVIPSVAACGNTVASQIRFPKTKAEGDIPQIAIVTGSVDSLECVMRKIGVADTEFSNPAGNGRINLYTGNKGPGAAIDNATPAESVLVQSASNLTKNDLLMLACQGSSYTPTPAALQNVQNYANAGGRIFATHYSYDYLTTNFPTVAQWDPDGSAPGDQTAFVNTTFPKGLQFAQWLQAVGASTTLGQVPVQVLRNDQNGVISPTQSFLSIKNPAESIQFTFNTPVAAASANQCGRVLFNEYHVETAGDNSGLIFPNECPAVGTPLTPQEKMLEYSIFDLSTFVSPDVPPTASVTFTNQAAAVTQGDAADTVLVTIANTSSTTPANPSLTATVALPVGLTATALAPQTPATSGWTCNLATLNCTRTTGLDAGASDPILLTFSVAQNAPAAATITATAAGGGLAANVSAMDMFPIKIVPVITWPQPAPVLYGTALSATQLNATVAYNGNPVAGSLVYTPAAGTVPGVGSQTLSVVFTPSDSTTYTSASATVTLQVNQGVPTITWATPAAITYGTALSTTQLNATAMFNGSAVPGTFAYSPAAGTVLNAGANQTLSVLFTPTDANTYTTANGSTTLTVTPAPLTISAGSYSGVYDGNAHALSACTVSANYDGLTCSNNPAGPVGPDIGSATVVPQVSGSTSNYTVTSNNGSWSITALPVTVTAGSYSGSYDGTAHAPSACTSSYTGVTCTNAQTSVGPGVGSGTVTPVVSYSRGIANDYSVTQASGTYSIIKIAASVIPNAASKVYAATDPALTGTLSGFVPSDGITATYSRTPGETVAGSPYTISATLASNPALANYNVTYNTAPFTINKIAASVTPNAASKVYGATDPVLTGTTSGFLPADGVKANFTRAAGETVAGSPYAISGTLSPTAALVNYAITYNTAPFTITRATPKLTWATPAAIAYGTALSNAQLNATANVPGSFVYSPASGILPAGSQTLTVTFTPTDSSNYIVATASVSLTVNKASTTTTLAVTTSQTATGTSATLTATVKPQSQGTPTGTVTYFDGSTNLGTVAVGTSLTVSPLTAGSHSITAVYGGDTNFTGSSSTASTVAGVAPTTVILTPLLTRILYPSPLVYTVQVPLKGLLTLISGTITLYDGATAIASFPILPLGLNANIVVSLSPGVHNLRAVYGGNGTYPPGQSPVVIVTVATL